MENASKALIIAGAILLSILLISLGIMVYNNAKGTINDANLDSESIQAFNGKFSQYCGSNKSADDVNALVQAVQANNASKPKTRITITNSAANTDFTGTGSAPSGTSAGSYTYVFKNTRRYNVTYTTATADSAFNKTGYINAITISGSNN